MSTPPAKFNDLADSMEAGEVRQRLAVATSEVRALGRRAAEAAQEIKALISASSHQGPQGVDPANQAGWVLAQLAEQVAQINGLVLEIAALA